MVERELRDLASKAKERLKEPKTAAVTLGAFSVFASLPLWLLLPMVFIALGLGLYIVISFLPFFVAGVVFGFTYWILNRVGMKGPWNWILPFGFGLLALTPALVPGMRAAVASSINAGASAMGLIGDVVSWIVGPILWVAAIFILAFLWLFLKSIRTLGRFGAFISGTVGLTLGTAIALNAIGLGGPAAVEAKVAGETILVEALPIAIGCTIAGAVQGVIMWFGGRR